MLIAGSIPVVTYTEVTIPILPALITKDVDGVVYLSNKDCFLL